MRPHRQNKPDVLTYLIVAVSFGMLATSIAEADSVVPPSQYDALQSNQYVENVAAYASTYQENWLVLGQAAVQTSISGGMAHVQVNASRVNQPGYQPGNTRFIFSVGLDEDPEQTVGAGLIDQADTQAAYVPTVFFTVSHHW